MFSLTSEILMFPVVIIQRFSASRRTQAPYKSQQRICSAPLQHTHTHAYTLTLTLCMSQQCFLDCSSCATAKHTVARAHTHTLPESATHILLQLLRPLQHTATHCITLTHNNIHTHTPCQSQQRILCCSTCAT